MGLMDKVKAQATQLAQKTQEAAQEGRAKLDQAQANRRGDALLRQLGAAVYAERTGPATPDSQAKIEQLISEISAHERENGLNLSDQSQANIPQQNSPADPASSPGPFPGPSQSSFPDTSSSSFPPSDQTFFTPPDEPSPGTDGTSGNPPQS